MKRTFKYQTQCPSFMRRHVFSMAWKFKESKRNRIWNALQRRETFAEGQIFPYRVEFDSKKQSGPFDENELNIHHGPFLSAHGIIGKVDQHYRSLEYFYGAYVLSFRWIRPVKLEFFKDDSGVRLKLISYVSPWMIPIYNFGLGIFWKFFGITFLFDGDRNEKT